MIALVLTGGIPALQFFSLQLVSSLKLGGDNHRGQKQHSSVQLANSESPRRLLFQLMLLISKIIGLLTQVDWRRRIGTHHSL